MVDFLHGKNVFVVKMDIRFSNYIYSHLEEFLQDRGQKSQSDTEAGETLSLRSLYLGSSPRLERSPRVLAGTSPRQSISPQLPSVLAMAPQTLTKCPLLQSWPQSYTGARNPFCATSYLRDVTYSSLSSIWEINRFFLCSTSHILGPSC